MGTTLQQNAEEVARLFYFIYFLFYLAHVVFVLIIYILLEW